jgi:RHS repeat-associated protein
VQSYGYDGANRLDSITSPAGTFTYAYNPGTGGSSTASTLISLLTLPNGAWITNTYDSNARMLGTWLYNSSGSALDSSVYTYNAGNQRATATRTGENTASFTYDPIGQVIGDQATEVSGGASRLNEQLHYAFDPAGNLTYRTNNALVANFRVNSVNELTSNTNGGTLTVMGTTTSPANSVTVNSTSASLYGDATFAASGLPLTTMYTATASDTYGRHSTNTVTVSLSTNVTFQYDGNGNLTNDGLRNFVYDDENELIQVSVSNAWMSQFQYDGKMRRRIRSEYVWDSGSWVQTNQVYYIYDGNLVIQERNANNLPTVTYTRGLDLSGNLEGAGLPRQSAATAGGIGGLLSMTLNTGPGQPSANSMYYHSDGNGNVTMLINPSQFTVAKYLYDAFGNTISKSGLYADANVYRFSSKEFHQNSGLVYYLYRYYDPNSQRWPNRDPLATASTQNDLYLFRGVDRTKVSPKETVPTDQWIGPNLYCYTQNNPPSNFDPLGLWTLQVGLTFSINIGPVNVTGSVGFTGDTQGHFNGYGTYGGGVTGGAGISGGVTVQGSNAKCNSDLGGAFGYASAGGGFGGYASGDYFWGNSDNGPVVGVGGAVGAGLGAGVSAGVSGTGIR